MLAVGVGRWPDVSSGGFDWKPLLLVVVALGLARFVAGLPLTWSTVLLGFATGTLWAWLIDAWGLLPPTALALLLTIAVSSVAYRRRDVD